MTCPHLKTKRGDNIPRRWGSFRSEVCRKCGSFRPRTHLDEIAGEWRPKSEYAAAIEPQELD